MLIIVYPNLKIYEELEKAIYKTLDYYQNEYPLARFSGLTSSEVRVKVLGVDILTRYPILPNPKIIYTNMLTRDTLNEYLQNIDDELIN